MDEVGLHPRRVELNPSVDVRTAITSTTAGKFVRFQPVDLAFDASLAALARIGIAVTATSTAAHLTRRSQLSAFVFLRRIDFSHSRRFEERTTLTSCHGLQETVGLVVTFRETVFADFVVAL